MSIGQDSRSLSFCYLCDSRLIDNNSTSFILIISSFFIKRSFVCFLFKQTVPIIVAVRFYLLKFGLFNGNTFFARRGICRYFVGCRFVGDGLIGDRFRGCVSTITSVIFNVCFVWHILKLILLNREFQRSLY